MSQQVVDKPTFSCDTMQRMDVLSRMFKSISTHSGSDFYFSFDILDGRLYVYNVKNHYDIRWVGGKGEETFGLQVFQNGEVRGPYHCH